MNLSTRDKSERDEVREWKRQDRDRWSTQHRTAIYS